jgi:protease I
MLRTEERILNFIRDAHSRRLLIASVCHGPQVLISSNAFPRETLATGVDDIRVDMANAGFTVLNELVVYDEGQRLITSPNPKALKEFCEQIGTRLREVAPVAGTVSNSGT